MKEQDKIDTLNKCMETIKQKTQNENIKKMIQIIEEESKEIKFQKLSREYMKSYVKRSKK